jgi:hypothetical protein
MIAVSCFLGPAAVLLACTLPAAAANFQEYDYPELGYSIQFPEKPQIESFTYKSGETSVPATSYSAKSDGVTYNLIVADFSKSSGGAKAEGEAVAQLHAQGEIRIDAEEYLNVGVPGRELTIANKDGSRSYVALFFTHGRLFRLEGKALPPDSDDNFGDALRFQESIRFNGPR